MNVEQTKALIAEKRDQRDAMNAQIEELKFQARAISVEISNLEASLPAEQPAGNVLSVPVNR